MHIFKPKSPPRVVAEATHAGFPTWPVEAGPTMGSLASTGLHAMPNNLGLGVQSMYSVVLRTYQLMR
jgi:hypothetical protein